jgi:hypothetical protein
MTTRLRSRAPRSGAVQPVLRAAGVRRADHYEYGRDVNPDSDKIGAFPGTDDGIIVRRSSGADYWDGES